MQKAWQAAVRDLLKQSRICFLATSGVNGPEASMAPYATHDGDILLHLSALAAHSRNIRENPAIGLMICTPETAADSPLALPRLSLHGKAIPVDDAQYEAAKAAYLKAIPDAEPLFSFSDFKLFRLTPTRVHWVGGFGLARKISLDAWSILLGQGQE